MRWDDLLMIAVGGAIGAVLRASTGYVVVAVLERPAFWGTLTVNVVGSLLLGFMVALVEGHLVPEPIRALLAVGLLGAFTTYSAFTVDTIAMIESGRPLTALIYVAGTAAICIIAAGSGLFAGRALL